MCVIIAGSALYIGGFNPFVLPSGLTATVIAQNNASCQALIDRAIQASGNSCGGTGSNEVCYGNTTIKAELAPDATQRFSERGDTIAINALQRLSASPLNLNNNEWGIAVFKVIANLPRSLPGETVTMVVFGNATLDNNSGNLESFYFTSELGQIACKKVPYDGLMITSPEGGGIRFTINGAELTLIGNASIKAIKNGDMEVSVYKGSGRLVSNGQEQYIGAGQKVSVQLGGENGNQSIGGPSEPQPLTEDELNTACNITGQYCSQSEITPVSGAEAQGQILSEITSTPTVLTTQTLTRTPSATIPPTNTVFVLPSWTPSQGPPSTSTPRPPRTPTRTKAPTRTFTPANTPTRTNTPPPTNTPTVTSTPTFTFTPTATAVAPANPICGSVSAGALTSSATDQLAMNITNGGSADIIVNRFFSYWMKNQTSQKLDMLLLDTDLIWNTSDSDTPSDIPTEGNWRSGANLTIPAAGTRTLFVQFQDDLEATGYEVHLVFDIGCQVVGTK